jgi:hypothetical protein
VNSENVETPREAWDRLISLYFREISEVILKFISWNMMATVVRVRRRKDRANNPISCIFCDNNACGDVFARPSDAIREIFL